MSRRLRAVDLFAGAGGLSIGLAQAGFRVVTAVESDPQAAATYAAAHPDTVLIESDVVGVTSRELIGRLRTPLDLLAAGPPCQGFSIKGQRRADHPGNAMIREVVRIAGELRPRAVLVENVMGLTSLAGGWYFDQLVMGLERINLGAGARYDVDYRVLNAAEHGTPQQRRRLFVVAVAPGLAWCWPPPTIQCGDLTLWDAIGDLPPDSCPVGESVPYPPGVRFSGYVAELRAGGRVLNHHTKRLEWTRLQRLAALAQGQDRRSLPPELAAGGHETKYRRLRANAPSPTLTAHMGKDLSDFIHPYEQRTLTVREAARVQGFPDSIEFFGSQASQLRQVGNSVPVPLARVLGEALTRMLRPRRRSPTVEENGSPMIPPRLAIRSVATDLQCSEMQATEESATA